MNIFIAIGLSTVLLIISFVIPLWLRRKTHNLKTFALHAAIFRQKAEALLDDPDTPVEIVDILGLMNRSVDNPQTARAFLRFLNKVRSEKQVNGPEKIEVSSDITEFCQKRPELNEALKDALENYLIASIFIGGGFYGVFARFALNNATRIISARAIMQSIKAANDDNHNDTSGHFVGGHHTPA